MNRLIDQFGRRHEYLRISVTDRCNLRCRYCLPASYADQRSRQAGMPVKGIRMQPKEELLTFAEIETLARIFVDLGVRKIRLTGGEPLIRHEIEHLCRQLAAIPRIETLALSTNGVLLAEKAETLKQAGVQHLNISLDSLRPEGFQKITLRNDFENVLRGTEVAIRTGFQSIKINTVIMKGFNDDELLDFVEFAQVLSLNVRFIEYMPFFGNGWSQAQFIPYREMKEIIETKYQLLPCDLNGTPSRTAKEFRVAGSNAIIGFITTMSEPFCDTCNRLRLTADGKLRNCLFAREEYDLKRLLRAGASTEVIQDMIRAAVILKWKQHPDANELVKNTESVMTAIGG